MKDEVYYDYIYDLIIRQSDKEKIPISTFDDVIGFFEKKEDYEKCKVLYEFVKDRKKISYG